VGVVVSQTGESWIDVAGVGSSTGWVSWEGTAAAKKATPAMLQAQCSTSMRCHGLFSHHQFPNWVS